MVGEGMRQETFLWIGDGGRPTYGVVEHCVKIRCPEPASVAAWRQQQRLYTLDRKPETPWPLGELWVRQQHICDDFLQWDFLPYCPYDTVFVDNILCDGYATRSDDIDADTWESPLLTGLSRLEKLQVWASRLAALQAVYVLTSGTADAQDPEDGDVLPDMHAYGYRLLAAQVYDACLHTGWYIWQRCDT